MSILVFHAVLAKAFLQSKVKTETQSEWELFEAMGAELDSQARRQRIVHLTGAVTTFWMGALGRRTK